MSAKVSNNASATPAPAEAETPAKKDATKGKSAPAKEILEKNPAQKAIDKARKAVGYGASVYCICKNGAKKDPACEYCKANYWDLAKGSKRSRTQTKPLGPEPTAMKAVKKARAVVAGGAQQPDTTRPEDTGADVKSDAPEKAACTLASNGKQSCIFSCDHAEETAKIFKVFDGSDGREANLIRHKAGHWDGEKHLAMTSDLNQPGGGHNYSLRACCLRIVVTP